MKPEPDFDNLTDEQIQQLLRGSMKALVQQVADLYREGQTGEEIRAEISERILRSVVIANDLDFSERPPNAEETRILLHAVLAMFASLLIEMAESLNERQDQ